MVYLRLWRLTRWSRLHCDLGWGALGHTVSSWASEELQIEATAWMGGLCGARQRPEQRGSARECPWVATEPVLGHIRGDRNRHV